MNAIKTKSLSSIEQKMEDMDTGSLRYHVLKSAKDFKTSWIELGRSLYSVWKDKAYREWGFNTFEAYTAKEIGIKKDTAMKLLRSYYFLEKEEPALVEKGYAESAAPNAVPSYDAVNVLRLAKSKKTLGEEDYTNLKKEIFENGKDAREVKKELTSLMRQREELDPEEARQKRRIASIRRFLGTLKALKQEIEISKLVSAGIIKEVSGLIKKLEEEINA